MNLSESIIAIFDRAVLSFINLIAPKPCVVCGTKLNIGETVICSICNAHLPRTHYQAKPYDNPMARMFWGRFKIEKAAALFYFEPQSEIGNIIYSAKYNNHPADAEYMGRQVAREFQQNNFFDDIDAIVPVPLTRGRMFSRGYNQSLELAKGLRHITGIPIISNAVGRVNFTDSQTHKNRWQRNDNVRNAFRVKDGSLIQGKHILIVDDVVTTGATITECANEIMKSADVKISVLSLGFTKY